MELKAMQEAYLTYAPNGNKVEILLGGTTERWTAYFKPQCEPKYQPVVVDFINIVTEVGQEYSFKK